MKKLEKMNSNLFENLKTNEFTNLSILIGGECLRICTHGSDGCEDVTYCDSNLSDGGNEISDMVASDVNGNDETVNSDWNSPDSPVSNNWDIEIPSEQYIYQF